MAARTSDRVRTTVSLDREVIEAARKIQAEEGISLSEAVNQLAGAGLRRSAERKPFKLRTFTGRGPKVDVTNVAEVLDIIEGDELAGYR